ncbi:glycosyltransferase family 2 protein [Pararhizobium arenae]|uniref:glycosyltransferase family 2 protein n=1 Tax=Pararhizobium arenae TaxID=1856850 RepID=UPI000B00923B|nr:glycosyltransferase family 2 protein [Pararhizobium arenae]
MATAKREDTLAVEKPGVERRYSAALMAEGRLLLKMGIGKPTIAKALRHAVANNTSIEDELLANNLVDETTYFEALAEELGLAFLQRIDGTHVHDLPGLDAQLSRPEVLLLQPPLARPVRAIAPKISQVAGLKNRLEQSPTLRSRLVVTLPSEIKRAAWQSGRLRRVVETTRRLSDHMPLYSARVTFWGRQGFYGGLLAAGLIACLLTMPILTFIAVHILVTLLFLANFGLRFVALLSAQARERRHRFRRPRSPLKETPLPIYSVLVALYREESVVPQLIAALDRLDWPRSRLDIKLICEDDDEGTIRLLETLKLPAEYEIIRVPVRNPRTKPKALTYALNGARGSLLTVYDAEDRPSPGQLKQAHAAFCRMSSRTVCLQAPLSITNGEQSWLSGLFSLEYAALFRGLLPMLSAARLPLPLGGTSNHFRTAALKQVGGWDPYNVTEDADLGMRLYRMGYRSRVISMPTLEDAPTDFDVWLKQRTRWYKGWLQTWLVQMRKPRRLLRELGWSGFLTFQVLIGGMLLSSLCHPAVIAFAIYLGWLMMQDDSHTVGALSFWLFIADIINIFGSYVIFIALGRVRMEDRERRAVGWRWVLTPVYWLALSFAAWRAILELRFKPFVWNKTPHKPARNL